MGRFVDRPRAGGATAAGCVYPRSQLSTTERRASVVANRTGRGTNSGAPGARLPCAWNSGAACHDVSTLAATYGPAATRYNATGTAWRRHWRSRHCLRRSLRTTVFKGTARRHRGSRLWKSDLARGHQARRFGHRYACMKLCGSTVPLR